MKSLPERIEDRIKEAEKNSDVPYTVGGIVGVPASAGPEIAKLAAQQAKKAKEYEDSMADTGEKDSTNETKGA